MTKWTFLLMTWIRRIIKKCLAIPFSKYIVKVYKWTSKYDLITSLAPLSSYKNSSCCNCTAGKLTPAIIIQQSTLWTEPKYVQLSGLGLKLFACLHISCRMFYWEKIILKFFLTSFCSKMYHIIYDRIKQIRFYLLW